MKSIVTILSVAILATAGFTGCATQKAQCHSQGAQQTCPVTKKSCANVNSCSAKTAAECPMTKKKSS
ncbi:MAG: hypothetical protein IAE94_02455 [Chthoniobacterales bacterium]|nr:hypothetical protein [Chthoniobacterales bacterium]